jgi:hypothetical protein
MSWEKSSSEIVVVSHCENCICPAPSHNVARQTYPDIARCYIIGRSVNSFPHVKQRCSS